MAELKRKITLKRKESSEKKNSKWWLWLLLALVVIVVVILLVKNSLTTKSKPTDESTPALIEQLATAGQATATEKTQAAESTATTPASEQAVTEPVLAPSGQPATKPEVSTKSVSISGSIEEKARRVIRGRYGNGIDRKQALGSEYNEIQAKVNEWYRSGKVR
jgi:outer membrane biosynthesis protein TonB